MKTVAITKCVKGHFAIKRRSERDYLACCLTLESGKGAPKTKNFLLGLSFGDLALGRSHGPSAAGPLRSLLRA